MGEEWGHSIESEMTPIKIIRDGSILTRLAASRWGVIKFERKQNCLTASSKGGKHVFLQERERERERERGEEREGKKEEEEKANLITKIDLRIFSLACKTNKQY